MPLRKLALKLRMLNWWPVSDEEWERLNYPDKFLPTK